MPKYQRKEPHIVEAFQYGLMVPPVGFEPHMHVNPGILVHTARGLERALVGDWIVLRNDGLREVYSPERFADLFEIAP